MKLLPLSIAVLAAGLSLTLADTIKLKNGEMIENCTITDETAEAYEVEVDLGNGIKDFRTIKKADVEKLTRLTPDQKEAAELKAKLDPSGDGMSAQDYEKAIKSEIQPWLEKYKKSDKRAEIEALLKLYNEELAKVRAGEIKLRGAWISADERKWNAYNVEARKLRIKIEDLIKERKYTEAYAAFAQMELTGAAGVDFPPVVEAIKKIVPSLVGSIKRALGEAPAKIKQRTTYLAGLRADQKKNEELRIKKERTEWTAKVAQEKKDKIRIPSYDPFDLKSIQDSLAAAEKEASVLDALDLSAMAAANRRFEQGLKDLHTKAFLSAKANFEAAAKVHSKDAAVKKYIDEATKAATAPPAGAKAK